MCPELNKSVVGEIIGKTFRGKFVRNGHFIWVEEGGKISHLGVAMIARLKSVDDAGQLSHSGSSNTILISGGSQDFNKGDLGSARDKTIEIAQNAVGNSARIIKR